MCLLSAWVVLRRGSMFPPSEWGATGRGPSPAGVLLLPPPTWEEGPPQTGAPQSPPPPALCTTYSLSLVLVITEEPV